MDTSRRLMCDGVVVLSKTMDKDRRVTMYPFATSIERAEQLFGLQDPNRDYLIIKISPASRSCCCFHCWPTVWQDVNAFLSPYGPIEDEGDALVGDEPGLVLECHESGPEIIVFLGMVTAYLAFATAVVGLVDRILASMEKDNRADHHVIIRLNRSTAGEVKEERSIELRLPVSDLERQQIKDALLTDIRSAERTSPPS